MHSFTELPSDLEKETPHVYTEFHTKPSKFLAHGNNTCKTMTKGYKTAKLASVLFICLHYFGYLP